MTRIDPSFYLHNQQTRGTGSNVLGKDDFLRILMAQIKNQSPLDPMKDREFISQMTQFSSLEQMMNMADSFKTFTQSQSLPPVIQYSHLIGKEVTYPVYDEKTGFLEKMETGVVESINQTEGQKVELGLKNGEAVDVGLIEKVSGVFDSEDGQTDE